MAFCLLGNVYPPPQNPRRVIDTLKESIRIGWADLASKNLTVDERKGLREHIEQRRGGLTVLPERPSRPPPVQRFDEDQGVSALRAQS